MDRLPESRVRLGNEYPEMSNDGKVEIALKVKAKNGKLQRFIEDMGWTQTEFGRRVGYNHTGTIGKWFNMKDYPRSKEMMEKICELVGATAAEIFPPVFRDKRFTRLKKEGTIYKDVEIDYLPAHEIKALPGVSYDPSKTFGDNEDLSRTIDNVFHSLTDREQEVLRLRFGLGDDREQDLETIARHFDVTRERIRQIEAKALRKLRDPRNGKALKAFTTEQLEPDPWI